MKKGTIILITIIASLYGFAPSWAEISDKPAYSKSALAITHKPKTALEFLRNFKFALDHDLFLNSDLYSDESLERVFSVNKIVWLINRPTLREGNLVARLDSKNIWLDLTYRIVDTRGGEKAAGRKQAGGVFTPFHELGLTPDVVLEEFGPPMNVTNPYAQENLQHPSALLPQTHRFGNQALSYKFERQTSTAFLYCLMNGDGTVNRCNFGNAEK